MAREEKRVIALDEYEHGIVIHGRYPENDSDRYFLADE